MNSTELRLAAQNRSKVKSSPLANEMTLVTSGGQYILIWKFQLNGGKEQLDALVIDEKILLSKFNNGEFHLANEMQAVK